MSEICAEDKSFGILSIFVFMMMATLVQPAAILIGHEIAMSQYRDRLATPSVSETVQFGCIPSVAESMSEEVRVRGFSISTPVAACPQ